MGLRILAVVLLLAGLAACAAQSRSNRVERWVPVSEALPLAVGQTASGSLTADRDGYYEVQIEVNADLDPGVRERYVTARHGPSSLGIDWRVERPAGPVAHGDAAGYLYIERGPRSRLGRVRRVLLQMPYGLNAAHRRSFGLRGTATEARGIGRFRALAGETYTLYAEATVDHSVLGPGEPVLSVRPERRQWQEHLPAAEALGYTGWLAIASGLGLAVFSRFRGRGPAHV